MIDKVKIAGRWQTTTAAFLLGTTCLGLSGVGLSRSAAAGSPSLGMVANEGNSSVTVFDAGSGGVLGAVPVGYGDVLDCAVNAERTRGFVGNFGYQIWVVDLTTTPPSLAAGTNPIAISTAGEDTALSPDGHFLLTCASAYSNEPISVVDVDTRTEVSTFRLGVSCTAVDVCADGSVLAASYDTSQIHRLTLDASGQLTDTGEVLFVNGPLNVACAPDGRSAVAVLDYSQAIQSFTVISLKPVDVRSISGIGVAARFTDAGDRVGVRSLSTSYESGAVDIFGYDMSTAGLSAAPLSTVSPIAPASTNYGVDPLALSPDGTSLFVSDAEANAVNVYDTGSGALLTSITDPSISAPAGVCRSLPTILHGLCTRSGSSYPCMRAGGSWRTDCFMEWATRRAPAGNARRMSSRTLVCYEGDPVCDGDSNLTNNSCTFRTRLCLNNHDPGLPQCFPSNVAKCEVTLPRVDSTDAADLANRQTLETQCGAGGLGVSVYRGETAQFTGVPNADPDVCSGLFPLQVPLRIHRGKALRGKRHISVTATDSASQNDADRLNLECRKSTCGDGRIQRGHEQCDDGNRDNGDGCNAGCHVEPGWACQGTPSVCNRIAPTPTPTATFTPTFTPGTGDCCLGNPGPGCGDATCQSCVCSMDSYCCTVQWDFVCANEATGPCAASCACAGGPTRTPTQTGTPTDTPTPLSSPTPTSTITPGGPPICVLGSGTTAVIASRSFVISAPLSGWQIWHFGALEPDATRQMTILPSESHFDCASTSVAGQTLRICPRLDATAYCQGGPNDGKACPPADCGTGNACAIKPAQGAVDCAPSGGSITGYNSLVQVDHNTNSALVSGQPNNGLPAKCVGGTMDGAVCNTSDPSADCPGGTCQPQTGAADPSCSATFTGPDGSVSSSCLEGSGADCSASWNTHIGACNSPTEQTLSGASPAGGFRFQETINLNVAFATCTDRYCFCGVGTCFDGPTPGAQCGVSDDCGTGGFCQTDNYSSCTSDAECFGSISNGVCAVCPPDSCPRQGGTFQEFQVAGVISSGVSKGVMWNVNDTSLIMGTIGAGNGANICGQISGGTACPTTATGAPIDLTALGGDCLSASPATVSGARMSVAYPRIGDIEQQIGDFIGTVTLQCQ